MQAAVERCADGHVDAEYPVSVTRHEYDAGATTPYSLHRWCKQSPSLHAVCSF